MLRRVAPFCLTTLLFACGAGSAATPAKTPEPTADVPAASPNEPVAEKPADADQPTAVPPPGEECAPYAASEPGACGTGAFTELLAGALGESGVVRDRKLACLEKASEAPAGLVRALRAELAPRGCADVVVADAANGSGVARELSDTLVGLVAGARLYRSVRQPPLPRPPFDKPAFLKHFKEVLVPWIAEQARSVDQLSKVGPRLSGYGRGVVALEAGLADLRFVSVARAVELPAEMKRDPEVRETYLVALEQALEPRVARGRDAALVGLGELSRQGVTLDARVTDARALLSELFAGRRLDALDRLALPPLPALRADTPDLLVASKLPAYYAVKLSGAANMTDPRLLRARLEQGVPPALWLDAKPPATPELAALSQRGLFQLGQLYFWAEPFTRAAAITPPAGDEGAALIGALAKVLARGPRHAAAMMLGPTTLPPELRETAPVDALAKGKGNVAGMAELDAAYLRALSPPANDPSFWKEQAARLARAQQKLTDKSAKALAGELAKAAQATEKELRKSAQP
jgi:hypothetical protein